MGAAAGSSLSEVTLPGTACAIIATASTNVAVLTTASTAPIAFSPTSAGLADKRKLRNHDAGPTSSLLVNVAQGGVEATCSW